jgi:hypothetical protein
LLQLKGVLQVGQQAVKVIYQLGYLILAFYLAYPQMQVA